MIPTLLVLSLAIAPQAPPAAGDVRSELSAVARALDSALAGAGLARMVHPFGAALGSRGYRIEGYGAIFVVPPRALPALPPGRRAAVGRGVQLQFRHLQRSLGRVESEAVRNDLARRLAALHRAAEAAAEVDEALRGNDDLELRAQVHAQLRLVQEQRKQWERESAATEELLRLAEEQAGALRREAERVRAEAERSLERVMSEFHIVVPFPEARAPEVVRAETPQAPSSPEPPDPPLPLFEPAPWTDWLEISGDPASEETSPEQIVSAVRVTLGQVLEAHGSRLRHLLPDEFVVIAADFVRRGALVAAVGPERTLVLRVRKRDLDARRAGAIDSQELLRRIEFNEY